MIDGGDGFVWFADDGRKEIAVRPEVESWLKQCHELVGELMERAEAWPFKRPVSRREVGTASALCTVNTRLTLSSVGRAPASGTETLVQLDLDSGTRGVCPPTAMTQPPLLLPTPPFLNVSGGITPKKTVELKTLVGEHFRRLFSLETKR